MNKKLYAIYKNDLIELHVPSSFYMSESRTFYFYFNNTKISTLTYISRVQTSDGYVLFFTANNIEFIPGYEYYLVSKDNYYIPIDYSFVAFNKDFEEKYRYDGTLGSIYSKEKTIFRVFSPFSSQIILVLKRKNKKNYESFIMNHNFDNGIFEISINEDLDESLYYYQVTMFSSTFKVIDPYSHSTDANSQNSFVVDIDKIKSIPSNNEKLPKLNSIEEAIIYETNIRDMTSLTSINNRATYPSYIKSGLKENDMPIGIDYFKYIKPTHIQIQPILDFQTIDENNPSSNYNWGYDPLLFFSFEGSYSTNPNNPYTRLKEVKEVVSNLHKNGFRVVLDVVYNHVYSTIYNPLSLLVPNYYFRVNNNLELSQGSGCGNEIESRNYMARKVIIDSALYLVELLDIDGLRFDLVSLIDINTLNQLSNRIKRIKKGFIMYGEGWNLETSLNNDLKSTMYNSNKLKDYAFFNDRFRDVVKGSSSDDQLNIKGYLLGDTNYYDGFRHVMLGSTSPIAFAPLFEKSYQSINYVECHDNHTLFDKIKFACPEDSDITILRRIKLILVANLFACGVPFFHAGEEFGQSKKMIGNTYNMGDELNGFNYSLASRRKYMIDFFKDAIILKKDFIKWFKMDFNNLVNYVNFDALPNGAIKVNYIHKEKSIFIIFNPTNSSFMYSFDDKVKHIFSIDGLVNNKNDIHLVNIEPVSVNIYMSNKGDNNENNI